MKIKLKESLDPELRVLGLKPDDEIEVSPDPQSKVGCCHFTVYRREVQVNCSIWPEDFKIIKQ